MKIFTIILIIISAVVVIGYIAFKDSPEELIAYQTYASELHSFENNNGTMKYFDKGEGQAILLLHGTPTNSWMYRKVAEELVNNGYRVIAPDLMGFGASDQLENLDDYDFDKQAEYLIDLMDTLGIESWEQATHDMGGLVSWHMVNQVPEKITHMYVLNTILYTETFAPPINFNENSSFQKSILGLHENKYIGKFIVNMMMMSGTKDYDFTNSIRAGYWLPLRDGAGGIVHFFTHTKEVGEEIDTYRSWLINSEIPVSIIWGEKDSFLDVDSVGLLQTEMNIPDDRIKILIDKKHLIAEEASDEVAEFIINN
ncbi:MAG: pimeloyl-ACP methyl ester carboxylesterase [Crocinitomicaceae bacterium]|jgi:pimeloyl-ACP methyl ester carboxylesterase